MSAHVPPSADSLIDATSLTRQWAAGALACSQSLMTLMDAQTTLWRAAEAYMAGLMQIGLDTGATPPSAQPFMDAAQGLRPLGPTALEQAWTGWALICLNALRHDSMQT